MEEKLIVDLFLEEKTHWWHLSKRALIRQYIKPRHGKVLVLGAGGGVMCKELKDKGYEVTAVDISAASCEHIAGEFGTKAVRGDLEKPLTMDSSFFDVIVAADLLEHLENDSGLLREIFRCLKPGGRMILTVPAYPGFWSSWDERLGHRRRYTSAGMALSVREAGFRIEKLTYFNTLICAFVYCYRKSIFYHAKRPSDSSDFTILSGQPWSFLFRIYYFLERKAIALFNMPFGLSILTVAVKNG
jgi:SAM-dependent methyltransferase